MAIMVWYSFSDLFIPDYYKVNNHIHNGAIGPEVKEIAKTKDRIIWL